MGVDAMMFARIKGRENWLQPDDVLPTAYDLASTIGSNHFLITKGNYPSNPSWEHHALSIVGPNDEQAEYYPDAVGRVAWFQDGDPIFAGDDEQFVKVHLWTRYYGEDYARGDWPTIRATAEWLELRFPHCEVWYGGDSSGICAEHLSEARRAELNAFYLDSGRKTYTRYRESGAALICTCCEVGMVNVGGGSGADFFHCDGCGRQAVRDRAAAWNVTWGTRHDDIFKLSAKHRGEV